MTKITIEIGKYIEENSKVSNRKLADSIFKEFEIAISQGAVGRYKKKHLEKLDTFEPKVDTKTDTIMDTIPETEKYPEKEEVISTLEDFKPLYHEKTNGPNFFHGNDLTEQMELFAGFFKVAQNRGTYAIKLKAMGEALVESIYRQALIDLSKSKQ